MLWPTLVIQSTNDTCYIYVLITMTYFVKVTRLNSTDYEIKKNVNAKMTQHINKLYVIISYFLCCKRQTKYQKTIYRETHCPAVCARINARRPVMVGDRLYWALFRAVSATRLLCILSTFIHWPQQWHFNHIALVGPPGKPTQKVALKTSPQHHVTKQQRHLGKSEAHPS